MEILQLDLVLPVTREDQAVLTHHYGVAETGSSVLASAIDAARLFRDAGLPLPDHRDRGREPDRYRGDEYPAQYPYLAGAKTAPSEIGRGGYGAPPSPYTLRPGAAGEGDDDSDLDTEEERRARQGQRGPARDRAGERFARTEGAPRLPESRQPPGAAASARGPPERAPAADTRRNGRGEDPSLLASKNVSPWPRSPLTHPAVASAHRVCQCCQVDMLRGMHELVQATEERPPEGRAPPVEE